MSSAVPLPDLSHLFDWRPILEQCHAVVHLAKLLTNMPTMTFTIASIIARLRHLPERYPATARKHLVFISSIAAQSGSYSDHELSEHDFPTPNNAYGRSKFAAEQAIHVAGVSFAICGPS